MYYFYKDDIYIVKQRIKEIAKEKDITMRKLAEMMEMLPVSLSRMLSNTGNITLSRLIDISNHLGVQLSDLLGYHDETQEEISGLIYYKGKRYIINDISDFDKIALIVKNGKHADHKL